MDGVFYLNKQAMSAKTLERNKNKIFSAKNILVVLPKHFDNDALLSASALFTCINKIANTGPLFDNIDFLVAGDISDNQKHLIEDGIVKYIKNDLEPRNYIVSIPCGDGLIDKVSYRLEEDVFKMFITPSFGELNVDDVKFDQIGSNYKLAVFVGFSNPESLGDIYEHNKVLFDKIEKVILSSESSGSVSEQTYKLLRLLKIDISKEIAQLLLLGVIDYFGGKFENIEDQNVLSFISEMMGYGASLSETKNRSRNQMSFVQLQLQQRLFSNIKQDSNGILWSVVNKEDLTSLQIQDFDINISSPIAFNNCEGYSDAFVIYELSDGSLQVRIESLEKPLEELFGEYGVKGSGRFITFSVQGISSGDFEKIILDKLGGNIVGQPAIVSSVIEDVSLPNIEEFVQKEEIPVFVDDEKKEVEVELKKEVEKMVSAQTTAEKVTPHQVVEEPKGKNSILEVLADNEDDEEYGDAPIVLEEDDEGVFGPPKIFNSAGLMSSGLQGGGGPAFYDGNPDAGRS